MSAQKEALESIRDTLAGKEGDDGMAEAAKKQDEDVLDLTDKVNEDGTVTKLNPKKDGDKDVLDEIDEALSGEDKAKEEEPKAKKADKESAKKDDKDVELELSEKERKAMEEKAKKAAKEEAKEEPKKEDAKEEAKEEATEEAAAEEGADAILSEDSADATKDALGKLKDTVKETNKRPQKDISPSKELRSGETVEDLVVEALKPMMKDWLDENLPKLVEEIVEREIDKLMPNN